MVKVNRTIGKARLYKIDRSSPMVKTVTEFERKLSMQLADQEEAKMKRSVVITRYCKKFCYQWTYPYHWFAPNDSQRV